MYFIHYRGGSIFFLTPAIGGRLPAGLFRPVPPTYPTFLIPVRLL